MDVSRIVLDEQNLGYANHLVSPNGGGASQSKASFALRKNPWTAYTMAFSKAIRRLRRSAKPWLHWAASLGGLNQ